MLLQRQTTAPGRLREWWGRGGGPIAQGMGPGGGGPIAQEMGTGGTSKADMMATCIQRQVRKRQKEAVRAKTAGGESDYRGGRGRHDCHAEGKDACAGSEDAQGRQGGDWQALSGSGPEMPIPAAVARAPAAAMAAEGASNEETSAPKLARARLHSWLRRVEATACTQDELEDASQSEGVVQVVTARVHQPLSRAGSA